MRRVLVSVLAALTCMAPLALTPAEARQASADDSQSVKVETLSLKDAKRLLEGSELEVDAGSLALGPVEVPRDFPEAEGLSDSELRDDLLESIPMEQWDDARSSLGLPALGAAAMSLQELRSAVESSAETGFGVRPEEVSEVKAHFEKVSRLHELHAELSDDEGFLTSRIDESAGTYTAWVRGWVPKIQLPDGAVVLASKVSRSDLIDFRASGAMDENARRLGLTVESVRMGSEGAEVFVSDSRNRGAPVASDLRLLEVATNQSARASARNRPPRQQAVDRVLTHARVEYVAVSPGNPSEMFCGNEGVVHIVERATEHS